jgi:ribulose-phosphate 3-epimerase
MKDNRRYILSASLICADFLSFNSQLKQLSNGKIDYIHFDFMDGLFVPRYGLFPELITQIRAMTDIPFDVHMMVEDAEKYLQTFVKAGLNGKEDIFIVHVESTSHIHRVLQRIKDHGIKAGVALNPGTSLSTLDYILPYLDLITVMGINPGIIGQKLIPGMLSKISDVKNKIRENPNIIIEVDGGVTQETAPKMIKAGADMLVCGSQTIFQPPIGINIKIKDLRKKIDIMDI